MCTLEIRLGEDDLAALGIVLTRTLFSDEGETTIEEIPPSAGLDLFEISDAMHIFMETGDYQNVNPKVLFEEFSNTPIVRAESIVLGWLLFQIRYATKKRVSRTIAKDVGDRIRPHINNDGLFDFESFSKDHEPVLFKLWKGGDIPWDFWDNRTLYEYAADVHYARDPVERTENRKVSPDKLPDLKDRLHATLEAYLSLEGETSEGDSFHPFNYFFGWTYFELSHAITLSTDLHCHRDLNQNSIASVPSLKSLYFDLDTLEHALLEGGYEVENLKDKFTKLKTVADEYYQEWSSVCHLYGSGEPAAEVTEKSSGSAPIAVTEVTVSTYTNIAVSLTKPDGENRLAPTLYIERVKKNIDMLSELNGLLYLSPCSVHQIYTSPRGNREQFILSWFIWRLIEQYSNEEVGYLWPRKIVEAFGSATDSSGHFSVEAALSFLGTSLPPRRRPRAPGSVIDQYALDLWRGADTAIILEEPFILRDLLESKSLLGRVVEQYVNEAEGMLTPNSVDPTVYFHGWSFEEMAWALKSYFESGNRTPRFTRAIPMAQGGSVTRDTLLQCLGEYGKVMGVKVDNACSRLSWLVQKLFKEEASTFSEDSSSMVGVRKFGESSSGRTYDSPTVGPRITLKREDAREAIKQSELPFDLNVFKENWEFIARCAIRSMVTESRASPAGVGKLSRLGDSLRYSANVCKVFDTLYKALGQQELNRLLETEGFKVVSVESLSGDTAAATDVYGPNRLALTFRDSVNCGAGWLHAFILPPQYTTTPERKES